MSENIPEQPSTPEQDVVPGEELKEGSSSNNNR